MMWGSLLHGISWFLHSSEFMAPTQYDSNIQVSLSDVTLDQRHPPTIICTHGQNLQAHLPSTSNRLLYRYAGQLLWPTIHAS